MTVAEMIEELKKFPQDAPVGRWQAIGERMRFWTFKPGDELDTELFDGVTYVGLNFGKPLITVDMKDWPK